MTTSGRRGHAVWAAGLASLVVLPDVLRLDRYPPFAQLVAFRPATVAGTGALALLAAHRGRRHTALALGTVAATGAAALLPRVVPRRHVPTGGRELTVLACNVLTGRAEPARLAEVIRAERPDLVALVEAGHRYLAVLTPLICDRGFRAFPSGRRGEPDVDGLVVLAAPELGELQVRMERRTSVPCVELSGGVLGRLRLVAMHAAPPVPGTMAAWCADLGLLGELRAAGQPAIVAGDFNATLDHSVLRAAARGWIDAAARRGAGLVGTWPRRVPRWLGPQIDHVFVTPDVTVRSVRVVELPGSDHRGVLARLSLPPSR